MIVVHLDSSWEDDDGRAHAEPLSTHTGIRVAVSPQAGWSKATLAELLGRENELRRQRSAGGRPDGGNGDG